MQQFPYELGIFCFHYIHSYLSNLLCNHGFCYFMKIVNTVNQSTSFDLLFTRNDITCRASYIFTMDPTDEAHLQYPVKT